MAGMLGGAVQNRLHPPDVLHGLRPGRLAYAAGFPGWRVLPRLGVVPPAGQQPTGKTMVPVGAHVVFRLATAAAFDALS